MEAQGTEVRLEGAATRARALLSSRSLSSAEAATESSRPRLGPPGPADVQAIARQLRRAQTETPGVAPSLAADVDRIAASLVERAQDVMRQIENGASTGSISDGDALALESVIRTRGRPALAVEGDRIEALDDEKHPGSGFWRIPLDDHEMQLVRVAGVTAAVMARDTTGGDPEGVRGTAWLVRGDLAITNRHVLFPAAPGVRLATRNEQLPTNASIRAGFEMILDFAFDDGPARSSRCQVIGVPFVSEANDPVDVAVLRVSSLDAAVSPLSLEQNSGTSKQLFLFGHPGALARIPDDVRTVFGTPNGRKRVSFGELMGDAGRPGEIAHDASTIGGFSGACVLAFGATSVAALHYYGDPMGGNRAITASTLLAHPIAAVL